MQKGNHILHADCLFSSEMFLRHTNKLVDVIEYILISDIGKKTQVSVVRISHNEDQCSLLRDEHYIIHSTGPIVGHKWLLLFCPSISLLLHSQDDFLPHT